MGGRRTHEGEDVGGDDEDDEEREEVDEPGAEREHGGGGGGGVARHGDAAGEGERAGVAEEGREGVGRLVARAHPRGGPEHQLSRDACSLPLCLRLPRGMGWAAGLNPPLPSAPDLALGKGFLIFLTVSLPSVTWPSTRQISFF